MRQTRKKCSLYNKVLFIVYLVIYPSLTSAALINITVTGSVTDIDSQLSNSIWGVGDLVNLSLSIDDTAIDGLMDPDIAAYFDAIVAWDFNFGDYNVTASGQTGVFIIDNADQFDTIDGFGAAIDYFHSQTNDGSVNGVEFLRSTFDLSFANNAFDSTALEELTKESLIGRDFLGMPNSYIQLIFASDTSDPNTGIFVVQASINEYAIFAVPLPSAAWLFSLSVIVLVVGICKRKGRLLIARLKKASKGSIAVLTKRICT